MKIRNVGSNMTEYSDNGVTVLFSYETPVAGHSLSTGWVKTSTKFSATTTRHVNKWLKGYCVDDIAREVPQAAIEALGA